MCGLVHNGALQARSSSFRFFAVLVVVAGVGSVVAGTARSSVTGAREHASIAAAPGAQFVLDQSLTQVDNPNAPNLTSLDAAAGTAHVQQAPVTWDETWKLPQTITPGKPASVTLGLSVMNDGPKPGPGQYNVGISVTADGGLSEQLLLDISSKLSGQQTYSWTVPDGSTTGADELVLVIHPYESASVTYHYRASAAPATSVQPAGACQLPSWIKHGRRLASARAINEVLVINVCPDVQFHKGGTPADAWLPLEKGQVLKAGDEISCDPDGAATLAFADSSIVTVRNTTQLKIGSFFTEGGVVKTEILLRMGEIAAQVNKSEATKSDFVIKPPAGAGSVRGGVMIRPGMTAPAVVARLYADPGSRFSVFVDPTTHIQIWDVFLGQAEVDVPGHAPITLSAGHEVAATGGQVTPVAAIGKAGAIGGINAKMALDRVETLVGAKRAACGLVTPRLGAFSIKASGTSWRVSLKAVAGKAKGWSTWQVAGSKATPLNGAARKIAAGCK